MATTTNYGWTTPDNTALVKDGASAIRTLGSSVDTSLKSLSPGTTAGDVDYYTSATAKARLAIGSTGQVLTVAAGVPSWATATSGGMTLISTTTLTGASITLSSIPQTYKNLYVVIRNWKNATDGEAFLFRFNADATANRHVAIAAVGTTSTTFGDTSIPMSANTDNTVAQGMVVLQFPDYTNTTTWKNADVFSYSNDATTTTTVRYSWTKGLYNQTTAITSLQFLPTSGGNLTSGTALLYGVS